MRRMNRVVVVSLLAAAVLAGVLAGACSGAGAGSAPAATPAAAAAAAAGPCSTASRPPRAYDHVVWIVMENEPYSSIVGSPQAPYVNRLRSRCGSASRFYGEAHPSLPNYIAMTSGSTHAIADDGNPSARQIQAPSIFSQVGATGWRSLQESMPSNCLLANAGPYAVRHNPAAYYTSIRTACASRDVPLGATPDISARFTFVTPNVCHDMHDCSVRTGDTWLKGFLPKILSSATYRARRTAVFLTWDEDDHHQRNHIPTLVIAPSVRAATTSSTRFDHYAMLRTTEQLLGLGYLGNAATARSMRRAFHL
jgi:hypothetical protein